MSKKARVHTEGHGEPQSNRTSHDAAPQAIDQAQDIEVNQQSDAILAQSEVGQKLRFMLRHQGFDGFDFQDQFLRDHDIRAKSGFQRLASITNRHGNLPSKIKPCLRQLEAEAFLINRFKQPWPKFLMDIDGEANHPVGQRFGGKHEMPLWFSVVLSVLCVNP